MAWSDVIVPRPGMWMWQGVKSAPGVYELVWPTGVIAGTWWPTADAPPDMHSLLANLADDLQSLEPMPAGPCQCGGDVVSNGMCGTCRSDHR